MYRKIQIPPPSNYSSFSPSELFRFFFQAGHWTEGSFSDEFQTYTRGTLVSTVSISKWKNRDVIPTRYSGPLFKMIEASSEPEIAKDWVAAFETVWALHSAGRRSVQQTSGATDASDVICAQHRKWIQALYTDQREGEKFSAADIYVPLQFYGTILEETGVYDTEDILIPSSKIWTFISGKAGSGKSMSALHMAAKLCEGDVFPIYIRGRNLSDIDIDVTNEIQSVLDAFSIKSFLKHFRASSFQTAYLILDGLDEIPHGTHNTLHQILLALKTEQSACAAHHKTLHIMALGRETHIEFAVKQVGADHSRHFSILSLDGSLQSNDEASQKITGQDLRPIWWRTYLAATQNVSDPTLPNFLSLEYDDFLEFGSDSFLSFLICEAAMTPHGEVPASQLPHERVNTLTFSANKNEIYKSITERLALNLNHVLPSDKFLSVLQHIAKAAWHSGGARSVAIKDVYASLEDPTLKAVFEALGLGPAALLPTDSLSSPFYLRLASASPNSSDTAIAFTHKTFPKYLVSTLVFDRFIDLISAFETQKNIENALNAWVAVSQAGSHDPSLADFCQKEAALRFDECQNLNWGHALEIIQNHLSAHLFNEAGLESLSQFQRAISLLFFIWSCLNLERQKRTGAHFHLSKTELSSSVDNFGKFQRPWLIDAPHGTQNFTTFALSGLQFSFANMSQLRLGLGHMENAIFEDTKFAMTHWEHVKVSESQFTRSIFQQANFRAWRVAQSNFDTCLFQGARLQGALLSDCQLKDVSFSQCHFSDIEFISTRFENVIFDRCVFSQSAFSKQTETELLTGAVFRHCTFLDMDAATKNIPAENMTGTISQSESGSKSLQLKIIH